MIGLLGGVLSSIGELAIIFMDGTLPLFFGAGMIFLARAFTPPRKIKEWHEIFSYYASAIAFLFLGYLQPFFLKVALASGIRALADSLYNILYFADMLDR